MIHGSAWMNSQGDMDDHEQKAMNLTMTMHHSHQQTW